MYAYRMSNTRGGSDKYGPCEVCKKPANSVYVLTEMRRYTNQDGKESVTYHGCTPATFGHAQCLAGITNKKVAP